MPTIEGCNSGISARCGQERVIREDHSTGRNWLNEKLPLENLHQFDVEHQVLARQWVVGIEGDHLFVE